MKQISKVFFKKLFGAHYEQLKRTLPTWLILFFSFYLSGMRIRISPSVLYLTVCTFSAGITWRVLTSERSTEDMRHLFLLPFDNRSLVFSYVSALGAYTLLTKTAGLFAILFAVCPWSKAEIFSALLGSVFAVLMTTCIFTLIEGRSIPSHIPVHMQGVVDSVQTQAHTQGYTNSAHILARMQESADSAKIPARMQESADSSHIQAHMLGDVDSAKIPARMQKTTDSEKMSAHMLGDVASTHISAHMKGNAASVSACGTPQERSLIHTAYITGRIICLFWPAAFFATTLFRPEPSIFLPIIVGGSLHAAILLSDTDAYTFYGGDKTFHRTVRSKKHALAWRYLIRYLLAHKNYLLNTVILWGIACILPVFFAQAGGSLALPIGFAVLSMNTPICILLSCDPSLEQALRILPRQARAFLIPYCLFIFLCSLSADMIFLCSYALQMGGIHPSACLLAVAFALSGALGSVLLEWFFPLRNWKTENDLWHHPRKYVIPAALLVLAGIASMP